VQVRVGQVLISRSLNKGQGQGQGHRSKKECLFAGGLPSIVGNVVY